MDEGCRPAHDALMQNGSEHGSEPEFRWLGTQPYEPMWHRLQQRAGEVASGESGEIIWSCEHEPVYTTGRRAVDNRTQDELPAPLVQTDRGGETTFHGTGQLMLYPIIRIRERGIAPRRYVHLLEQSAIDLLAPLGVTAERICTLPGVWVDGEKIAAIGLRISGGVAYHGMALNVDVKPGWFDPINPCGTGRKSVSLVRFVEKVPGMQELGREWSLCLRRLLEADSARID